VRLNQQAVCRAHDYDDDKGEFFRNNKVTYAREIAQAEAQRIRRYEKS
jgi:hypothetical protein